MGKNWAGPFFSHPESESIHLVQMVIWVEKTWDGPFFPHPSKWKHQPYRHEYAKPYKLGILGGGEKLGPFFTHPEK